MKLGTTTWQQRNTHKLIALKDTAARFGIREPHIIEYGPGGATRQLLPWLPRGQKDGWSAWTRAKRVGLRALEGTLRKTNLFALQSCEPAEIAEVFQDLSPQGMYIVDKEPRVLAAVMQWETGYRPPFSCSYHLVDLNHQTLNATGDIVIAYNVAKRTRNPEASLRKIAHSTRIGGLLSTGATGPIVGFQQLGDGLYLRER